MKKTAFLLCLLALVVQASAQLKRDDAFHQKYKLREAVVLSRHNIRSPLSYNGSAMSRITPHKWFEWTSAGSELSLRGGVLETQMGHFFKKWLESEGLLQPNERPDAREMRFYANSMQRTVATAQYFSSAMLPIANVTVERHCALNVMDPTFHPQLTMVSEAFRQQAMREIAAMGGENGMQGLGERVKENLVLLEKTLDLHKSPACTQGDTCSFRTDDTGVLLEVNKEPAMTGSLKLANQAADALILQYYEESDPRRAAFGHKLKQRDWERFQR